MPNLTERFGKLITASLFIIGLGILLFVLTPVFYGLWQMDTDLPGLIILTTGLAIMLIGIIRRKRLSGWKLAILTILIAILLLPALALTASLIYFGVTGKPAGS